jgi:hypothetical protein
MLNWRNSGSMTKMKKKALKFGAEVEVHQV